MYFVEDEEAILDSKWDSYEEKCDYYRKEFKLEYDKEPTFEELKDYISDYDPEFDEYDLD